MAPGMVGDQSSGQYKLGEEGLHLRIHGLCSREEGWARNDRIRDEVEEMEEVEEVEEDCQ